MRRDLTSGWLPKLLFVLITQTAHKTQYGKGPILCDGVSTLTRAPWHTDQGPFQNPANLIPLRRPFQRCRRIRPVNQPFIKQFTAH
ncbi:hypothetical protein ACFL5Z_16865, partial [Planctomycetota bacterium]